MGDTWIHGVGSDPARVAEYRELLRWRAGALQRHGAPALARFDMLLMKVRVWGPVEAAVLVCRQLHHPRRRWAFQ